MLDSKAEATLTRMRADMEAQLELAGQIQSTDRSIPDITALIMAGDLMSARRAEELLARGETTFDEAITTTGSFARLDAALRWQEAGHTSREHLLDLWPSLWRGSDPDDTEPRFLAVWHEARDRAGDVVHDGKELPVRWRGGRPDPHQGYVIWRGQPEGAPVGMAWSLARTIAEKFARGAWARVPVDGGHVLTATVERGDILAYLTGRGESEVIVDPSRLVLVAQ